VSFLERSAAVALSTRPQLAPRRSVAVSPLEWVSEVCEAAMREKSPQEGASDHVQQSVVIFKETPLKAEAVEEEEDTRDSEFLNRGKRHKFSINYSAIVRENYPNISMILYNSILSFFLL